MKRNVIIVFVATFLIAFMRTVLAHADEACIPATGAPSNDPIDVMFTRARADLESRRFEDAAIVFRYLAMHHSEKEIGIKSAPLYLEAINEVGLRMSRPACMNDIARDVPRLRERFCDATTSQLAKKNAATITTCELLDRVQADLTRLDAMNIMKEADKLSSDRSTTVPLYEKAGSMLMSVFSKHCSEPLTHNRPPRANGCDEMAYQASRAFRLAALVPRALATLRELVLFDEANSKLTSSSSSNSATAKHSDLAMRSLYEMGSIYQSIGVYDQAADWYERYAKMNPSGRSADRALSDAVVLRLGLHQDEQATNDVQLFLKTFGAGSPIQAAQVVFALAAHHAENNDKRTARAVLEPQIGMIDRNAPVDLRIHAHTLLARIGVTPHDEYAKVRALWVDPLLIESKLRSSLGASEDSGWIIDRRMAKALNDVGEATFADAEEHRATNVDPLRNAYPAYAGPNDSVQLTTHVQTTVKTWYDKRVTAIEVAERDYIRVSDLKPFPPPRWIIASSSRAAFMWADLADDLAKHRAPPAWMKDAPSRASYVAAIDALRSPIKSSRAIPSLRKCVDLSVKYQFTDKHSQACDAWLVKNDKTSHHAVDEILPQLLETSAISGASLLR